MNGFRIFVTTGEPAGVGPELMYHLTTQKPCEIPLMARNHENQTQNPNVAVEIVLVGDKDLLKERMSLFNDDFELVAFHEDTFNESTKGKVSVFHVPLVNKAQPSILDEANASYVLKTLDVAIDYTKKGICDAVVTGPISKSVITKSGLTFTGHTEYFEEKFAAKEVVMMLGCDKMNVALVTTHLPLKDVAQAITKEKLTNIIQILHKDLKKYMGFPNPAIYVCGINPHAGEDGTLGHEEIDVVIPVLEELRAQGYNLKGPLPADTIFQPKYLKDAAAVLTMYHDQGLPVLKFAGFDTGFNTTLGLPMIRTSVDHGTAFDLAGKAQVDPGSLHSAMSLAIHMVHSYRKSKQ